MTGAKTRGQRSQFDYHSCVSLIVGLTRARAGSRVSGVKAAKTKVRSMNRRMLMQFGNIVKIIVMSEWVSFCCSDKHTHT